MRPPVFLSALACLATTSLAQSNSSSSEVTVVVEASHGGAGNGLTNTTLEIPLDQVYTNSAVLDEVSYLFVTAAKGVNVRDITCTPYASTSGSGSHADPFTSLVPSLLSTNTVQVGSIVCKAGSSSNNSTTSSTSSTSTSSTSTSTSTSSTSTSSSTSSSTSTSSSSSSSTTSSSSSSPSVVIQTVTSSSTAQPTVTETQSPSSSAANTQSTTTSAQPGLSTGSSGAAKAQIIYSGLAIVGLGVAFAL